MIEKGTILTTKILLKPEAKDSFADWQAQLNAAIAKFPGFVSLEILAPTELTGPQWLLIQRFTDNKSVEQWRTSTERNTLIKEATSFVEDADEIQDKVIKASDLKQGGVTEVFITEINPEKDTQYREWIAKIHQIEAKFPGFRGVYVQSPHPQKGKNWITLLQFDTPENLERWLQSKEREQVLKESKPLIAAIESHRVITPYAGWFLSLAKNGDLPPAWKQTMIVLLVLYPIVMLELKYLSPLTLPLGPSLSTFISNAISVSLLAWPMVPLAISLLGWWLTPTKRKRLKTILGTLVVLLLYLLEIGIFWKL